MLLKHCIQMMKIKSVAIGPYRRIDAAEQIAQLLLTHSGKIAVNIGAVPIWTFDMEICSALRFSGTRGPEDHQRVGKAGAVQLFIFLQYRVPANIKVAEEIGRAHV